MKIKIKSPIKNSSSSLSKSFSFKDTSPEKPSIYLLDKTWVRIKSQARVSLHLYWWTGIHKDVDYAFIREWARKCIREHLPLPKDYKPQQDLSLLMNPMEEEGRILWQLIFRRFGMEFCKDQKVEQLTGFKVRSKYNIYAKGFAGR